MSLLSNKEKSILRSSAQTLKPSVFVGKQGLQEGVVGELKKAFAKAELVKVAFKADRIGIVALIEAVEVATQSECVGGVGKRRSFYRRQLEEESDAGAESLS